MSRIAVIGAGIAGLAAARALTDRGHSVVVWDKGRRPGGRLASRRRARFDFDHGAQYFTARDERFRARVERWAADGIVAPWAPRVRNLRSSGRGEAGADATRWVGVPRMRAVAEELAIGLEVRSGVRIGRAERFGAGWRLYEDSGRVLPGADVLLVTTPPAQAAPLLAAAPELADAAARVAMQPCWAVLLGYERPLDLDYDAAFLDDGGLGWVARNSSKPGRSPGEAWVLHADPAWSRAHLEATREEAIAELTQAFARVTDRPAAVDPEHAEAHRWRWAIPDPARPEPFLLDESLRLGAGGDWCGGPRVEGAWISGVELANRVAATLERDDTRVEGPACRLGAPER